VIYLAEMQDGSLEVVDGQQRLTTIRSFLDGKYPNGDTARLGKLRVRSELSGKTFQEICAVDQEFIENYLLRIVLLLKEADPDLKFEVFERLNSGADKLNDMELRNSIYRGPYNDLLKALTHNELLLKIRGDDEPDKRMRDRQLILRFFAMWRNTHLKYRGPMKQFMNREMQDFRNASPEKIEEMRRVFENAIQCTWDVFGDRAFRRYTMGTPKNHSGSWESSGKLNVALWDTLLYVFTYYERRQILPASDAIREVFLDLMATDATFDDYIGRTTDQPERIRYRAETWKKRVDALVTVPANELRIFSRQLKMQLFSADPTCALCGQHIQSVDDAELDHVINYWRGGPTSSENARLAHRYCNRIRGGRGDDPTATFPLSVANLND
jgi:5-methylcytosine-specific restriction endonuclease McrA